MGKAIVVDAALMAFPIVAAHLARRTIAAGICPFALQVLVAEIVEAAVRIRATHVAEVVEAAVQAREAVEVVPAGVECATAQVHIAEGRVRAKVVVGRIGASDDLVARILRAIDPVVATQLCVVTRPVLTEFLAVTDEVVIAIVVVAASMALAVVAAYLVCRAVGVPAAFAASVIRATHLTGGAVGVLAARLAGEVLAAEHPGSAVVGHTALMTFVHGTLEQAFGTLRNGFFIPTGGDACKQGQEQHRSYGRISHQAPSSWRITK
jgi:hypothetical protein